MSTSADLVCVDPKRVKEIWPHVSPLIFRAMQRGGMGDFFTVECDVKEGDALLWLASEDSEVIAAAITSLGILNNEKICTIVACGGEGWTRFGHLIEGLEQHARDEGCKAVRINGRPGWLRVLSGYRTKQVIIEKAL